MPDHRRLTTFKSDKMRRNNQLEKKSGSNESKIYDNNSKFSSSNKASLLPKSPLSPIHLPSSSNILLEENTIYEESPTSSVLSPNNQDDKDLQGKYVGSEARSKFFDRMKFMSHHNQISKFSSDQKITKLHFDHLDQVNDEEFEKLSHLEDIFNIEHQTQSHLKSASRSYVTNGNGNLPAETPRSLASLILNSALPPIVLSGPSKSKRKEVHAKTPNFAPTRDVDTIKALNGNHPKSCPHSDDVMSQSHQQLNHKFNFLSPRVGPTESKIKSLPSLDESSPLNDSSSHYAEIDPLSDSIYISNGMATSSYQSPKLQASLSKYNMSRNDKSDANMLTANNSYALDSGSRSLSPRSKFISKCLEKKMHPRASVIVRKGMDHKSMDLHHLGLGNEIASILAECLRELPYDIQAINLSNNGLDGRSIVPLLNSIQHLPNILNLNLSYNIMDKASMSALSEILTSKSSSNTSKSKLETLILQHTDIDDSEADKLLNALQTNRTLIEFDLSNNKIGSSESRKTIQASYVTFTEALSLALSEPECSIRKLDLSWNTIRLSSGVALAKSLRYNTSLTYLDLSYNSLVSLCHL